MSPNLNPTEILEFLQCHKKNHLERRGHSGGLACTAAPGQVDRAGAGSHHYAPTLNLSEESADQRYPLSLMVNKVTTPSLASSSRQSQSSDEIFDVSDVASGSSASTVPPLQGPAPGHLQRPMIPTFNREDDSIWLPCEFDTLSRCLRRFRVEEVQAWIQHIIEEHLRRKFPSHSKCWFCDVEFAAASSEDYERCYLDRMSHNAEHFREGGVMAAQRRPDHPFLDHVYREGLIDAAAFQNARRVSEVPRSIKNLINPHPSKVRPNVRDFTVIIENSRTQRKRAATATRQPA